MHGEHHGQRQRREQVARRAAEEDDGHEHDADAERGNEGGDGDLRRAIEDGFDDGLALAHVAMNVFDFDGGVVDQDADGQRQAAERHDVDGFAQQVHDGERGEDGERDGDADDDGGAPASQEQQDHQAGEEGGDGGLFEYAVDGGAHEDGLIEQQLEIEGGGQRGADARQNLLDAG